MQDDTMKACADLVLADAIEDLARENNQSKNDVRKAIMTSKAYESLYDFETGLWQDGPAYFIEFYKRIEGII